MGLKVDQVNLEIVIKSDAARTQIRKLEDEAINLQKGLKGMKKGTVEYVQQSEKLKNVRADILKLQNSIELTGKSMKELRSMQQHLTLQLNNMTPGTAKYFELQNQLKQVNGRMGELRLTASTTGESLNKMGTGFNAKLATIYAAVAGAIASVGMFVKSTIDAGVESEKAVQRLGFAVKNVGGGDDSDIARMRKQAEKLMGVFDDEDIMQAQTTMLNYGLTVEQVTEIMPLMVDAAAASGKSLDEMATAVDKGVASGVIAKSALGQLGLAFKDTGSRVENFSKVQEGLTKFQGGNTEAMKSQWGTLANLKIRWNELKETIGATILKAIIPAADSMADLLKQQEGLSEKAQGYASSVYDLVNNLDPLLTRYDELAKNAKRSKEENAEMKTIIGEVTTIMPGAATAFDSYGNAIAISTTRVRGFIQDQITQMKWTYKEAIKENEKYLKINEEDLRISNQNMAQIKKTGTYQILEVDDQGWSHMRNSSQEETAAAIARNKALLADNKRLHETIASFNGDAMLQEEKLRQAAQKKQQADEEKRIKDEEERRRKEKQGKDDPFKEKLKALDADLLSEQVKLKQSGKTQEDINQGLLDLTVKYLTKKRDLYKKDSAEYNDFQNQLLDLQTAKAISAQDVLLTVLQESHAANLIAISVYGQKKKEELLDQNFSQEDLAREQLLLDKVLSEKRLQEALDYAVLIRDAKFNTAADKKKAIASADEAVNAEKATLTNANLAIEKSTDAHLVKLAKLREELGLNKEKLNYKEGLKALKEKLQKEKFSEKETADAIAAYKLSKAQEYAQESVKFVNTVANFVSASNDAQAASLEASKQRELTAAGNNADKRQEIEKKYAQKELDLKKKQADANMTISIAQAVAQGALGIAEIWAKTGVNPIYAGILTAILVGVTAAQIASAVEQRNTIKSTSLGYRSGGYTGTGPDDQEDGAVHKNEFVTAADGVRNPSVRKFLDVFNVAQKKGTIRMLNTTQILEQAKIAGGSRQAGGYGSSTASAGSGSDSSLALFAAFADVVEKHTRSYNKLMKRLDVPLQAESVISGSKGSYEQTKRFEKMLQNVNR